MRTSSEEGSARFDPNPRRRMKIVLWGVLIVGVVALGFWGSRFRGEWRPKRLLEEADEKWHKADYLAAAHDYDRLVESYPTSALVPEAYYWKGVTSLLYLDDPKGAVDAFEKAIASDPPSPEVDFGLKARRYLAETYERYLNRPSVAIAVYEAIIEVTPDPGEAEEARYKIGGLYEAQGDFAQARVEWDILVKKYPESAWAPAALYRKGGTYFVMGNCKKALKTYTWVYTSYPESEVGPFAKYRAANCLEMGKQKEAAYALYKELKDGAYPDQADIARKIDQLKPGAPALDNESRPMEN